MANLTPVTQFYGSPPMTLEHALSLLVMVSLYYFSVMTNSVILWPPGKAGNY
jgi:hypothetical protein